MGFFSSLFNRPLEGPEYFRENYEDSGVFDTRIEDDYYNNLNKDNDYNPSINECDCYECDSQKICRDEIDDLIDNYKNVPEDYNGNGIPDYLETDYDERY